MKSSIVIIYTLLALFQQNASADFETPKPSHEDIGKEVHSRILKLFEN